MVTKKVQEAISVLGEKGITAEKSMMCLGSHFIPHEGIKFPKEDLEKVRGILRESHIKFHNQAFSYRGAQLNL